MLSLKTNMRVCLTSDPKAEQFSELLLRTGDGRLEERDGLILILESV